MGLSMGGLIRGGAYMRVNHNTVRQNEQPHLKKAEENLSYYSSIYSLKILYLKSYLWLKNRNQRVDTQARIQTFA